MEDKTISPAVLAGAPVNSFYGARVAEFMAEDPRAVVGALTTRAALEYRGNQPEQARAWQREVELLSRAFNVLTGSGEWGLLLEYSLRRLGRRPDAVILAPGVIIVVEFKIGAERHAAHYVQQAEDYALCIRDFHDGSGRFVLVPIVCAELAPAVIATQPSVVEAVASPILANAHDLPDALRMAVSTGTREAETVSWRAFDSGPYNPTPTIVDAARAVYAGHSVAEIGRSDADGMALQRAAERLRHWVLEARRSGEHIVCLVSGTPGAGKSLLGLNLVLADGAGRVAGEPAVMLTGNRPLVQVLRGALIADSRARGDNGGASRAVEGALQTLLGYLRQHAEESSGTPPEHVLVFDEAQRAWDEETGQKLLQRRRSEPELFLEILHRLPWACLVCLVGEGQEINRGEGGMALWGEALAVEDRAARRWRVVGSPLASATGISMQLDASLHLANGVRAYRNPRFGEWVEALLAGNIEGARRLSRHMSNPAAQITRDVKMLKEWLRLRQRGGRRGGLVVSSGATRLVAEGVPAPPMSNDLKVIENWFLKSRPDFRGSDSLEVPLSEFGCQGLELDYVGLCWGGDLIWLAESAKWMPRQMRAPSWQAVRRPESARYRINAYRVLLTRAREGTCIYVPRGAADDPTRSPAELDGIAGALLQAGCIDVAESEGRADVRLLDG